MSAESKLLVRYAPVKTLFHGFMMTGLSWVVNKRQVGREDYLADDSIQLLLIHEHSRLIERRIIMMNNHGYIWNYYHTYKSNLVLRNWILDLTKTRKWVTWTVLLKLNSHGHSWISWSLVITWFDAILVPLSIFHDNSRFREMYRTLTLS